MTVRPSPEQVDAALEKATNGGQPFTLTARVLAAEVKALRAEVERAETTLREIVWVATDLPHARRMVLDEMRETARVALGETAP